MMMMMIMMMDELLSCHKVQGTARTRNSKILPLLCSSTPLFPIPPLVSSKGVGLIHAIGFQDFKPGGLRKTIFFRKTAFWPFKVIQGH